QQTDPVAELDRADTTSALDDDLESSTESPHEVGERPRGEHAVFVLVCGLAQRDVDSHAPVAGNGSHIGEHVAVERVGSVRGAPDPDAVVLDREGILEGSQIAGPLPSVPGLPGVAEGLEIYDSTQASFSHCRNGLEVGAYLRHRRGSGRQSEASSCEHGSVPVLTGRPLPVLAIEDDRPFLEPVVDLATDL